jgi:hypothetical protein
MGYILYCRGDGISCKSYHCYLTIHVSGRSQRRQLQRGAYQTGNSKKTPVICLIMPKSKLIQLGEGWKVMMSVTVTQPNAVETPAAKFADPKLKADLTPLDNSSVEHFNEYICKRNQSDHCRIERVTGKKSKIDQYLEAQPLDAFGWWLCGRWLSNILTRFSECKFVIFKKLFSFFSFKIFKMCFLFENFLFGLFHPVFSFHFTSFIFL